MEMAVRITSIGPASFGADLQEIDDAARQLPLPAQFPRELLQLLAVRQLACAKANKRLPCS